MAICGAPTCRGFAGYAVSLVYFVLALRYLGTARTGAYFSMSPFVGTITSLIFLEESTGVYFWLAFMLMAAGIALHLTGRHEHMHERAPLNHTYATFMMNITSMSVEPLPRHWPTPSTTNSQ